MKGEIPGGPFTTDELLPIYRNLKRRKAPDPDQITYEHFIFGGELATQVVVKLFNEIVLQGNIPYSWKKGFIVPLFKGADKPKTSSNSYRPVALLSCFLKIFESVLNNRIKQHIIDSSVFPCTQQQGFQEKLSCLTASFNLHETIYHNLEQGNSVYVSFLDSTKAFDTVWRHGLLVKLYNMGIKGQLWPILHDCNMDTSRAIVLNQT